MTGWMKLALAAAVAAAIGVIVATIAIGAGVREETVVARPYEEGLRHDAERALRASLGLALSLEDERPVAGAAAPLALRLADREGRPVSGARVAVELTRPDTGRGGQRAAAPEDAGAPGRYLAALAPPEGGPWDLRVEVERGEDRVRLERRVVARPACDLAAGPCRAALPGGGEVTLELSPRPLRTMADLAVRAEVRPGAPAAVSVAFTMPGMEMGPNVARLAPGADGGGAFAGRAVLVRCPSGRRDWVAEVAVERPGAAPVRVRFPFTAGEGG